MGDYKWVVTVVVIIVEEGGLQERRGGKRKPMTGFRAYRADVKY